MKSKFEISEDMTHRFYDSYSNSFVIECIPNLYSDDGRMVGIIRLCINSKKKYLRPKQYVKFSEKKVQWRCNPIDNRFLVVVNTFWVTAYNHDPKMPVVIPVQLSKINIETDEREYYEALEEVEMTYDQYVMRKISIDFRDWPLGYWMAYTNYIERLKKYNDYYRALNETAKHYLIPHEFLKSQVISKINNAKKKYKKEWLDFRSKYLQDKINEQELEKMVNEVEEIKPGKVVQFNDLRF